MLDASKYTSICGKNGSTSFIGENCTVSTTGTVNSVTPAYDVKTGIWSSTRITDPTGRGNNVTAAAVNTESNILLSSTPSNWAGKDLVVGTWAFHTAPSVGGRFFIGMAQSSTLTSNPSSGIGLGASMGFGFDDSSLELKLIANTSSTSASTSTGITVNSSTVYRTSVSMGLTGNTMTGTIAATTDGLSWPIIYTGTVTLTGIFASTRLVCILANGTGNCNYDLQLYSLWCRRS